MPVPGGAVHHDLAVLDAAEGEEAGDGGDEAGDSGGEMESVGVGDDVEGVGAAAAGVEGDALRSQLMPGEDLAGEEEQAEGEGCEQPGQGATRGRPAEAEPLFHGVDLVEHVAARDLHGDGAEQQDGGVEPEDGRDGGGQPGIDVAVVGVDVAGGFGVDEDADDADEEHDDGPEGEEEAEAVGGETLAGAARAAGRFIASCRYRRRRRCA